MSKPQNKPVWFRPLLGFSAVASVLGVLWILSAPEPVPEQDVPQTGALMQRSVVTAPAEFDSLIKNVASARCFDIDGYGLDNGDSVQQWDCNNTLNQRIWADAVPETGKYRLRVQHSGKCLEPASVNADAEVQQWVCHNGDFARPNVANNAQHWRLDDAGQGRVYLISSYSGLALTSTGTANGDVFSLQEWTGNNNQKFEFSERVEHQTDYASMGSWGDFIAWPHVPVHAAVTPNNTVVTWASNEVDDYPQDTGNKFSWSSVYDLDSASFLSSNNPSHDMFCAGTTLLEDGSLLASGGNPQAAETSHFDPASNSWSLRENMSQQRWYGTNVVTGDGDVFSTFAKGAQAIPEMYSTSDGTWRSVPGADMAVLRDEQDLGNALRANASAELQWYAFMHTSPDGRVFQSGPTKTMHWYDTDGQGAVEEAGTRFGANSRSRQFGSAVMYDVGKLLVTGGSDPTISDELSPDGRGVKMGSTDTALTIDINGAAPVVESVDAMNSPRANHNGVVLPNGEVFVNGGTEWGLLFDDRYTAWWPEIWNPDTRKWRTVAAMSTPRGYHSWSLLLQDGRVLTGGGGLCGDCSANHPDAQIYTPPYLFQSNGELATRFFNETATTESKVGGMLTFKTDKPVSAFNMIRLSSVTHSINTDQRFIPLKAEDLGANVYMAQLNSNVNVMIPGMYWVFALDSDGVPSEGHLLQVKSTAELSQSLLSDVLPSGELVVKVGDAVNIQLPLTAFDQSSLSSTTFNLPAGLSFDESTGLISGSFSAPSEGAFLVSMTDGSVQTTERIVYKVTQQSGKVGGGGGSFAWFSLLLFGCLWAARSRR